MSDSEQRYKETEYKEICASHRAITDFRAKLLGLLPVATGAGLFLLKEDSTALVLHLWAIGLFGFAATAGLAIHEFHAMHQCTILVERGKDLENQLGLNGGQFGEQLKLDKGTEAYKWEWGVRKRIRQKGERTRELAARILGPEGAAYAVYGAMLVAWAYIFIRGLAMVLR